MSLANLRRRVDRLEQRAMGPVPPVTLAMLVRASYEPDFSAWLEGEVQVGRLRDGGLMAAIAACMARLTWVTRWEEESPGPA